MVSYGFYNSINYDRLYDAMQMGEIFDGIINDGILSHYGEAFEVSPGGGLSIIVGIGRCWFDHTWTLNDADLPMVLEPAELVLDRIDAVVIEVDARDEARKNSIKIIKGTPGDPAQKPELTNTTLVHQHAIAYISVPAECREINQGHITDNRGQEDCHFADALLDVIDVTELMKQWLYQFNEWFNGIQNTVERYLAIFKGSLIAGDTEIVITDLPQVTKTLGNTMPDHEYIITNKIGQTIHISIGDYWISKGKIYKRLKGEIDWKVEKQHNSLSEYPSDLWQLVDDPQDTMITKYSVLSFYTSVWGVAPKEVEVLKGAVRLRFEKYTFNIDVAVSVDG